MFNGYWQPQAACLTCLAYTVPRYMERLRCRYGTALHSTVTMYHTVPVTLQLGWFLMRDNTLAWKIPVLYGTAKTVHVYLNGPFHTEPILRLTVGNQKSYYAPLFFYSRCMHGFYIAYRTDTFGAIICMLFTCLLIRVR